MEKLDPKINAWLLDHLIPRLAVILNKRCSGGKDAHDIDYNDIECTVTKPRGSFFLSDLFFACIRFPRDGPGQEYRIIVKLPPQKLIIRSRQDFNALFDNEILFYKKLATTANSEYPACYLADDDKTIEKFIVLENVCVRGFFTSTKKVNVSMDYTIAALKSIARFHGNTYALKERKPDLFRQIEKDIIKIRYGDPVAYEKYKENVNFRIERVTRTLKARNDDSAFTKRIADLFEDCFENVLLRCVKPIEPLATIVHGDCTINNVLFRKHDNGEGEGLEAMLIDFALMMYSSPAIDVSTFLYMTCSREDIKERFEDMFRIYHDCLVSYLKEQGVWNPIKYSFKAFWEDYREHAIFGYVIGAFFLPMMVEYEKNNGILQLDDAEVEEINTTGGGEALSNLLVDMLIDMREAGLLDSYVNNNNADKHDVCRG